MDRTDESQYRVAILELLEDGRIWTNQQIKYRIEKLGIATSQDKVRANERDNEPKWHTIVNNALTKGRGLYKSGAVESRGHGQHQITETGRGELSNHRKMVQHITDSGLDQLKL